MKKVIMILLIVLVSIPLTSCKREYDFTYDELVIDTTTKSYTKDELTLQMVEDSEFMMGKFKEGEDDVYLFMHPSASKYLQFIFKVMTHNLPEVRKTYSSDNPFKYVTLDIENQKLYIVPVSAGEDKLKDILVLEFDIDVMTRNNSPINKEELLTVHEILKGVNYSSIFNALFESEDESYPNILSGVLSVADDITTSTSYSVTIRTGKDEIFVGVGRFTDVGLVYTEQNEVGTINDNIIHIY